MKTRLLSICLVAVLLFSMTSCLFFEEKDDDNTQTPNEKTVLTNAMDLTDEWNKVSAQGSLVQGCVVVRRAFLEEHPNAVEHFLNEYEASIAYLSTDVESAAQMIVTNGIFTSAPVAKKALPNCNICYITGNEMKEAISIFYEKLFEADNSSIGSIPDDGFYYVQ